MCLEFLFSSHREEDGPEHNRLPRNHANDATRQNKSGEQKNGDYYPDKNDPPSKPRYSSDPSANGSEHRQMMENQVVNDRAATNGDTNMMMPKEDHPKVGSNTSAFNGGNKVSNAVHPSLPSDSVPRHVGNNTVTTAPAPAAPPPNPRRGVESNDSVPHVGNNTVSAAPVPQPNPRRGVESNVLRDNGGTRYRKVPKPEEEEEDEEED